MNVPNDVIVFVCAGLSLHVQRRFYTLTHSRSLDELEPFYVRAGTTLAALTLPARWHVGAHALAKSSTLQVRLDALGVDDYTLLRVGDRCKLPL